MDGAIQQLPVEVPQYLPEDVVRWAEQERRLHVQQACEELRTKPHRLTEEQIALVAEVMADVRMLSIKLGR
jgi:hypothetical protein